MGITKTNLFKENENQLAMAFKALGHPARLAIVNYLVQVNTCICGDIVNELPLAQPTISQHLKALKEAGIITGTISGNTICYCLNQQTIGELTNFLNTINQTLQLADTTCCA